MATPPVGYFQLGKDNTIRFEIRKNHLISQTYIANFKNNNKVIVNLPWQFRLSKTINIYLDKTEDIIKEYQPEYLYINNVKVPNKGIINLTWEEILKLIDADIV
jgi:hypothetical protein